MNTINEFTLVIKESSKERAINATESYLTGMVEVLEALTTGSGEIVLRVRTESGKCFRELADWHGSSHSRLLLFTHHDVADHSKDGKVCSACGAEDPSDAHLRECQAVAQ